jgi:hypothetical protein
MRPLVAAHPVLRALAQRGQRADVARGPPGGAAPHAALTRSHFASLFLMVSGADSRGSP